MMLSFETGIVRFLKDGKPVGVGMLIGSRYILTCVHVVNDVLGLPENNSNLPADALRLDFPLFASKMTFEAHVNYWLPSADIAGLQLANEIISGTSPENGSINLHAADDLWGHSFRVFGFPSNYDDGVWASGILRGPRANGWVQLEDPKQTGYFVQPGFSGSPVWDDDLKGVVGIVVAADTSREIKVAFLIPVGIIFKNWPYDATKIIVQTSSGNSILFEEQDLNLQGALELARSLIYSTQYQDAIVILNKVALLFSNEYQIFALLGIATMALGEFKLARQHLAKAIVLGDQSNSTKLNYSNLTSVLEGSNPMLKKQVLYLDDAGNKIDIAPEGKLLNSVEKNSEPLLSPPPLTRVDVPAMQPEPTHFGVISNVQIIREEIGNYLSKERMEILAERAKNIIESYIYKTKECIVFTVEDETLQVFGESCDSLFVQAVCKKLGGKGMKIVKPDEIVEWLMANKDIQLLFCAFSGRKLPIVYQSIDALGLDSNAILVFSVLGPDKETILQYYSKPALNCLFYLDAISLPLITGLIH